MERHSGFENKTPITESGSYELEWLTVLVDQILEKHATNQHPELLNLRINKATYRISRSGHWLTSIAYQVPKQERSPSMRLLLKHCPFCSHPIETSLRSTSPSTAPRPRRAGPVHPASAARHTSPAPNTAIRALAAETARGARATPAQASSATGTRLCLRRFSPTHRPKLFEQFSAARLTA